MNAFGTVAAWFTESPRTQRCLIQFQSGHLGDAEHVRVPGEDHQTATVCDCRDHAVGIR